MGITFMFYKLDYKTFDGIVAEIAQKKGSAE